MTDSWSDNMYIKCFGQHADNIQMTKSSIVRSVVRAFLLHCLSRVQANTLAFFRCFLIVKKKKTEIAANIVCLAVWAHAVL